MKRKPDPAPYLCKCGCGRTIKPVRLTMRGCWSKPAFATKDCRDRTTRAERETRNQHTDKPAAGTWVHWDRFLYGSPVGAR